MLAATLALSCAASYAALRFRTAQKSSFVPYHIFVRPNLHVIAIDFELVQNTEEAWARISAEIDKLPNTPWNLWHWQSGFSVSLLSPELIYNNASNSFATEIDLYASLKPLAMSWTEGKDHRDSLRPRDPFEPSLQLRGHRLNIELMKWHWEKICHKAVFKDLDKEKDVSVLGEGLTVIVKLAKIPFGEFDVHFVKAGDEGFLNAYESTLKRREKARASHGWKGKADTGRYGSDIPPEHSNTIEHRYFTVSHSAL